MLLKLVAITSAILPWLAGAAVGTKFTLNRTAIPGFTAIVAGVGGFLGYLVIALIIWAADQLGFSLLRHEFLLALGLLTTAVSLSIAPALCGARLRPEGGLLTRSLYAVALLYLTLWGLFIMQLPAQGWDVLDHWGLVAAKFESHGQTDKATAFSYSHYHPIFPSIALAWANWCGALHDRANEVTWAMPFLAYALSAGLIIWGWTFNQLQNPTAAIILVVVALSMPLFENHTLLAGYGELPLGLSILSATVVAAIGLREQSLWIMTGAGILLITPMMIKNTGIVYALAPALGLAIVLVSHLKANRQLLIAVIAASAVLYVSSEGLILEVGTFRFGYDATANRYILGWKALHLHSPSTFGVIENELHSRLKNSSFSIAALGSILAFIMTTVGGQSQIHRQFHFISLTFMLLLLEQTVSQFTVYGFKHAMPTQDTGLSRFSLPVFMLAPILIAATLNSFQSIFLEQPKADKYRLGP